MYNIKSNVKFFEGEVWTKNKYQDACIWIYMEICQKPQDLLLMEEAVVK